MKNTIITVYADGASAAGETTEAPRNWKRLQSEGGARRNVAEAVIEGTDHDAATLTAAGMDFLSGKRRAAR